MGVSGKGRASSGVTAAQVLGVRERQGSGDVDRTAPAAALPPSQLWPEYPIKAAKPGADGWEGPERAVSRPMTTS